MLRREVIHQIVPPWALACGRKSARIGQLTTVADEVTCKRCLAIIAKRKATP
jgi:hypothetical protein